MVMLIHSCFPFWEKAKTLPKAFPAFTSRKKKALTLDMENLPEKPSGKGVEEQLEKSSESLKESHRSDGMQGSTYRRAVKACLWTEGGADGSLRGDKR